MRGLARRQLTVAFLGRDALRARLSCTLRLRGNELTIEGEDDSVAAARAVVDELDVSGRSHGAGTRVRMTKQLGPAVEI